MLMKPKLLLNNKGQVLVLFVILLPVLLLALFVVVEISNLSILKSKTTNTIREIISYGLNNNGDDVSSQLNNLIDINIKYDSKEVFVTDNEIEVRIVQNEKLFGRNIELKYNYKGTKEDKIVIEEG